MYIVPSLDLVAVVMAGLYNNPVLQPIVGEIILVGTRCPLRERPELRALSAVGVRGCADTVRRYRQPSETG
jgi:hypothetical protein